jgi:hypothetical protein
MEIAALPTVSTFSCGAAACNINAAPDRIAQPTAYTNIIVDLK